MMRRYEELLEQYEDARFALIMHKVVIREGEKALQTMQELADDPAFEIPVESFEKCRKVIGREYAKIHRKRAGQQALGILRGAALAAVVGVLCFTTAFAVSERVRIGTLNFFLEKFDTRTDFSFLPQESKGADDVWRLEINWLPEGYALADEGSDIFSIWKTYNGHDGQQLKINISQNEYMGGTIDTEDAAVTDIEVNGVTGLLIEKNTIDRNCVFLFDADKAITVSIIGWGIHADDILRVAENIQY